jgi:radical SAM protein with 4Fe4S-binding SPASM domain
MTLSEIEKFTISLHSGIYNVNLTGGETFLRKDIPEICELYIKNANAKVIQLFTNGWFTERTVDCLDNLSVAYPDRNFVLSISIDDLHDAHNDYRKLKDGFRRAHETYQLVRNLDRGNIDLDIGLTVSHANEDHLDKIYDVLVQEYSYKTISCSIVRGDPLDPETKEVDLSNYERFTNRLDRGVKTGELVGFQKFLGADLLNAKSVLMRKQVIPATIESGYQSNCYAGRLIGVVYANGDVYPCEILDKKIGNLRDYEMDIGLLWKSSRNREVTDWIWSSRCHCTHECFLTVNVLFNPKYYPRLLWEYSKIKIGFDL